VAASSISVRCSGCNASFKVKPELAGKRIRCSQCGQAVAVPPVEADPASAPAAPAVPARRRVWLLALALLALLPLGLLVLLLSGFFGGPAPTPPPVQTTADVDYDFRGKPRPAALAPYGPLEDRYLKAEAEGLRVTLPRDRPPVAPLGLSLPLNVAGDFEVTLTLEVVQAEEPSPKARSYGVGVLMSLNQSARIGRLARATGNQVVTWDHYATVEGKRKFVFGAAPCEARVVRLQLKRTDQTLHFLWAPQATGGTFQEFHAHEFGGHEIRELRLELDALSERQAAALDIRLIGLRIRAALPKTV
jgi:hypothetical protein